MSEANEMDTKADAKFDIAGITAVRRAALAQKVAEAGLDAYYCRNTSDIRWLTGFDSVFDSESAHLALVRAGDVVVHTDSRYSEAMESHAARGDLEVSNERETHAKFAAHRLAGCSGSAGAGKLRIGIDPAIALGEFRKLAQAFEDASIDFELVEGDADPVRELRKVKDASEVALMRRAQQITDAAFAELLGWIAPGMTEKEVANELEYSMRKLGATGLAFATIAASGPHSSMPHAVPSDKLLQKGEFLVLDFGARYLDYCADMTRTIAIGEPSAEMVKVYDAVLEAQTRAKAAIKPDLASKSVHQIADDTIAEAGYAGKFTHSLGHGVGIDIHEDPNLSSKSPDVLAPGNVVTVEPGIYIPGFCGVRTEDYGVVTPTGFDTFTISSHELQVVE